MPRTPTRRKSTTAAPSSSGTKRKQRDESDDDVDINHPDAAGHQPDGAPSDKNKERPSKRTKTEEREQERARAKAAIEADQRKKELKKQQRQQQQQEQEATGDSKKPVAADKKKQAAAAATKPSSRASSSESTAKPSATTPPAASSYPRPAAAASARPAAGIRPAAAAPARSSIPIQRTPPRPSPKAKTPFQSPMPPPAAAAERKSVVTWTSSHSTTSTVRQVEVTRPPPPRRIPITSKSSQDGSSSSPPSFAMPIQRRRYEQSNDYDDKDQQHPTETGVVEDDDSGYQTGDSDQEVREQRLAAIKKRRDLAEAKHDEYAEHDEGVDQTHAGGAGNKWWDRRNLPGWLPSILGLLIACLVMPMVLNLWQGGSILPSLTKHDAAPCFASTSQDGDASFLWSEPCKEAKEKNQLAPCPPAGICKGGELVSCGLEKYGGAFFAPSSNGLHCELSAGANDTLQDIVGHLQKLTVAHKCHERSAMRIHGKYDGDLVMFDYYEFGRLVDSDRALDDDAAKIVWADTMAWLKYAVDNTIVTNVQLEQRASDKDILIGLSPKEVHKLPLPLNCAAQQAFVSTLKTIKSVTWKILIDGLAVHTGQLIWFIFDVLYGSFLSAPALVAGFTAVVGLLCCFVYGRFHATGKRKQLEADAVRAEAATHKCLKLDCNTFHKARTVRDIVKNELYANDAAAQKRFVSVVWPKVTRRIEKDGRIEKYDKIIDGTTCVVWRWSAPV